MSNVAKLKKQAAEFELKKQFDKALAIYTKLLDHFDEHGSELDVALFNRVGDLQLRQGNVADALDSYERAVDRYSDGGFYSNAIALCNKILRHSPGRSSVYYKLGKISAQKGFKADAKQNFLEYAERMRKAGNTDEAFRALTEFADLCPDQEDIRLMLSEQLTRSGRTDEALNQLQTLYARYEADGRQAEAAAALERMRAIDPDVQPRSASIRFRTPSSDLVFLDLDESPQAAAPSRPTQPWAQPKPPQSPKLDRYKRATPEEAFKGELLWSPPKGGVPPTDDTSHAVAPLEGLERSEPEVESFDAGTGADQDVVHLDELSAIDSDAGDPGMAEALGVGDIEHDAVDTDGPTPLVELEPTSLADSGEEGSAEGVERATPRADVGDFDFLMPDPSPELPPGSEGDVGGTPLLELNSSALEDLPLLTLPTPVAGRAVRQGGELTLVEFDLPTPAAEAPAVEESTATPSESADAQSATESATEEAAEEATGEDPGADPGGAASDMIGDADLLAPIDDTASLDADADADAAMSASDDDPGLTVEHLDEPILDAASGSISATPAAGHPSAFNRPLTKPSGEFIIAREFSADDASVLDSDEDELESTGEHAAADDDETLGALEDESLVDPDEVDEPNERNAVRTSTGNAERSVEVLRILVEESPGDLELRRLLAEALFEAGDREEGIEELEAAMSAAERGGDLDLATSVAEELARLEPYAVRYQQKRVEYAFRRNDRGRLVDAYVALADALAAGEQIEKARAVYERVLELAPDESRARTALDVLPYSSATPLASSEAIPSPNADAAARSMSPSFVNLGDWLRDEERPRDTRMVVAEEEPSGDEEADFAEMLRKFKEGVAENVDPTDYQSHYDLAIAYMEMGLIDEAIQGFQKSLSGAPNRLPSYEALGHCFLEKGQARMASNVLRRALDEPGANQEQLVGVLYLLGRSAELLGRTDEAMDFYQRVFVTDIEFRDVAERMAHLEQAPR